MGTVLSSTVVIVSGSISTNTYRDTQWLTLGITVSSSSSGTCTTSTAMVLWTKTILNAWLFATLSSRARVTGTRLPSKRTRRSWLTCGTKLLSWLTSIRTVKLTQKNLLPLSKKNLYQLVWPPRSHRISVPASVKRTYVRRKKSIYIIEDDMILPTFAVFSIYYYYHHHNL